MPKTTTVKWAEPVVWIDVGDGVWRGEAVQIVRTDDWRDTAVGRVNFGNVLFGDRKWVTRPNN